MMKLIIIIILGIAAFSARGQLSSDISHIWSKELSSDAFANGRGFWNNLEIADNGDLILTGEFLNNLTFCDTTLIANPGATDIFISKIDSLGNLKWIVQGFTYSNAWIDDVEEDSAGNIYVLFHIYDTVTIENIKIWKKGNASSVIAKFSTSGNLLWYKEMYGNSVYGNAMTVDINGNVYSALYYTGYIYLNGDTIIPTHNISMGKILIKHDDQGNLLWYKNFYTGYGQEVYMKSDKFSNVYLTGVGGNIIIDSFNIPAQDIYESHLIKIKADGQVDWIKTAVGVLDDVVTWFTFDKDQNIYWCGNFRNSVTIDNDTTLYSDDASDMILIKYDNNGIRKWVKKYGGPGNNGAAHIAYSPINSKLYIAVGGPQFHIDSFSYVHPENRNTGFIARFDLDGNFDNGYYIYGGTALVGDLKVTPSGEIVHLIGFKDEVVVGNDTFSKPYDPVNLHGVLVKLKDTSPIGVFEKPTNNSDIFIYPNPTSSQLIVKAEVANKSNLATEIYDINGRLISSKEYHSSDIHDFIDVSAWPKGIYLVRLTAEGETLATKKVVVQ